MEKNTKRDEAEVPRSIRFPKYVWDSLDEDAKRSRRSPVRQLEAILVHYYKLDPDVDVSIEQVDRARDAVSQRSSAIHSSTTLLKPKRHKAIEDALDAAMGLNGKPLSKKDRDTLRKKLEEEESSED